MKRSVLALDFGASSGRAILATYDGTAIHLQEVHRFVNEPLLENGHLFWNVPELMNQLEIGLQKAFLLDSYESIGIDTWGVDYGLLDKRGVLLENPRHYRDGRSAGYPEKLGKVLPLSELYRRTGTQIMDINTLFQLMQQKDAKELKACADAGSFRVFSDRKHFC